VSSYNFSHVGRLVFVMVVILVVCLDAEYYLHNVSSSTAIYSSVAEAGVVRGVELKQPLKNELDKKDEAFTGFKPF